MLMKFRIVRKGTSVHKLDQRYVTDEQSLQIATFLANIKQEDENIGNFPTCQSLAWTALTRNLLEIQLRITLG